MKKINTLVLRRALRDGSKYSEEMKSVIKEAVRNFLFPTDEVPGRMKYASPQVINFLTDLNLLEEI
jgi:hypothetical protein